MELNIEHGDRRKEPRYAIWIEAKVMISEDSFIGAAKNISGGGMEIQMPKAINPNTNLTVSLQLHEEFVFHGKVVWTLGDYINKKWVYRVGIKTDAIDFKDGTAIEAQEKRELILEILPYIEKMGIPENLITHNAA